MKRRREESGFALLLLMAMAAIIAVLLYRELPRVAFEGQRAKEDLLVQRGEQYKRAIQLYMRRFARYPASLDQLENTNNMRFLRRRYRDPMTGSEEWRLIHAGPGGVLTDSLTQKPPQLDKDGKPTTNAATTSAATTSGTPTVASITGTQADPNAPPRPPWFKQRQSDLQPPAPAAPSEEGTEQQDAQQDTQQQQQQDPSNPQLAAGQPVSPDNPQQPGAQPDSPQPATQPLGAQQPPGGAQPSINPFQPAVTGQPQQQQGGQFGASGQFSGGATPPMQDPSTNPINLINQQLRGGVSRMPTGLGGSGSAGPQTIGAGIAGVASKAEDEGIKVYRKHTKYNEWEFIYDQREDYANPASAGFGGGPSSGGGPQRSTPGPVK